MAKGANKKSVEAAAPSIATASVPPPTVHPLARKLAALLSPMSLTDQRLCFLWSQRIMYTAGVLLYPVAWYIETFRVFAVGVLCAAGLCCVLFLPNWYQHPDPEVTYVSKATTREYYDKLQRATAEDGDGVKND